MSRSTAQPAKRAATYEDLLAAPEPLVAEILFGELVTHPRPAPRHSRAAMRLGALLSGPFDLGVGGPGGWVFLGEPELHLGEHVVVPDLAGWHQQRLSSFPDTAWIETAPDWVCEVLSPSTESYDRGGKRLIYAGAGIAHVWHISPSLEMLESYELREGKWLLLDVFSGSAEVTAVPFADFSFSLDLLWSLGSSPPAQGRDVAARPRTPTTKTRKRK